MSPIPKAEYCARVGEEIKSGAFWRDAFSEMVATFFLVAVQIILLQDWHGGAEPMAHAVQVSVGMALVAASVGYGLGDFGGGHMNCAITFAMLIRAEITLLRAIIYWIMQLAGGIAAAFFVSVVTPQAYIGNLGMTTLGPDVQWWQGIVLELLFTLMLCLAALGTQNVSRKGYVILPSIPVGFALGLGLFIGLPTTGGSLNPARSLGPAVAISVYSGNMDAFALHWVYWAGPMGGAFVAAILYWIFDSVEKPGVNPIYEQSPLQYKGQASVDQKDPSLYPRLH